MGFFWPSKPTPADLEKVLIEALAPAMLGELKIESIELLGYEGSWAKTRIVVLGEESVDYFYWESGEWKYCNLIGGMNLETAKQLKVPGSLWPTPEELKKNREREETESSENQKESLAPASHIETALKAAEQGDSRAMFTLGKSYADGSGVSQSDNEALDWYRKAAELDNADAQLALGLFYDKGRGGLATDPVTARMWYILAGENGNMTAQELQLNSAKHMTNDQIRKAQELLIIWKTREKK